MEKKRGDVRGAQCPTAVYGALAMEGGVLRVGGEGVAFTWASRAARDTFVVHIEKARRTLMVPTP